jgi:hypothetical protein
MGARLNVYSCGAQTRLTCTVTEDFEAVTASLFGRRVLLLRSRMLQPRTSRDSSQPFGRTKKSMKEGHTGEDDDDLTVSGVTARLGPAWLGSRRFDQIG